VTLISSIITDAYRESNMLALGQAPSTNQSTEALRLLNALFAVIYGGDAGEFLTDWPLGNFGRQATEPLPLTALQITNPPINQRLIVTNEGAITVYLTVKPQDGSRMAIADPMSRLAANPVTLNANGREIEASSTLVLSTDALFQEWMYRADLGDWVRITDKIAADEMPFPTMFDMMFVILLAMRLNPRYGRQMDPQSVAMLQQSRKQFIARYVQTENLSQNRDLSRNAIQSFDGYGYGSEAELYGYE
jgi:hypothetical protein